MSARKATARKKDLWERKAKLLFTYTVLFAIVAFFSLIEFIINKKAFLFYDTITEYVTSLSYWGTYLRNVFHTFFSTGRLYFPQWDFSIGLGADIVQTLNWYVVGDPLTLFSAFVKPNHTIYLHHVLVILRLYLAGIAFLAYCRHANRDATYSLCGAFVYAFSGYAMFLACRHTYFINPFIYLPLLYIGVDKILARGKPFFFSVCVFFACATNFYFFYILTILLFVYAIVRFFFVYKNDRAKNFARCFLTALIAYLVGVMMAAVVFFPSVAGFLHCGRAGAHVHVPLLYEPIHYVKLLLASITPSYIASYTFLGFAPVFMPLMILCVLKTDEKSRELKVFALIYLLWLCFPIVGSMFNGFNYVTNRWMFAVSFFAGLVTVHTLPAVLSMTKKEKRLSLVMPLFLCLLVFAAGFFGADVRESVVVPYCVLAISIGILFLMQKKKLPEPRAKIIFVAMICVSVSVNAYVRFSPRFMNYIERFYAQGSASALTFGEADDFMNDVDDDSFFRYEFPEKPLANNAMLFNKNGTSFYFSEVDAYIIDFIDELGLATGNEMSLHGFNGRSVLQSLAAVKYIISKSDVAPFNYEKIANKTYRGQNYWLYQNKNALPLGFTYDRYMQGEDFNKLTMAEKQAVMASAAVIHDVGGGDDIDKKMDAREPPELSLAQKRLDKTFDEHIEKIDETSFTVKRGGAGFSVEFAPDQDAEQYLAVEGISFTNDAKQRFYVYRDDTLLADVEVFPKYYPFKHNVLINVGNLPQDRAARIRIEFAEPDTYTINNLYAVSQPLADRDDLLTRLKATALENVSVGDDYISGTIRCGAEKFLCLSIPYSPYWKAFVDGEATPLYRTQIMYSGLFVERGDHSVELKYANPYIFIGAIVSCIGFALLLCAVIMSRKKRAN